MLPRKPSSALLRCGLKVRPNDSAACETMRAASPFGSFNPPRSPETYEAKNLLALMCLRRKRSGGLVSADRSFRQPGNFPGSSRLNGAPTRKEVSRPQLAQSNLNTF